MVADIERSRLTCPVGLSGRAAELAQLDQLLTAAVSGAGGLLVIVGGPGSGKTALLAEVAADAGLAASGRRRLGYAVRFGEAQPAHRS